MRETILFALFLVIAFILGILIMYFFGAVKSSVPVGMLKECSETVSMYREDYFDCRDELGIETSKRQDCENFLVDLVQGFRKK